jgi:quercetin dioxygenase-like cupin family protein
MEIVNAVSKVRFASSGPQRVHLARAPQLRVDLICMEAGQKDHSAEGPCAYYVIAGSAQLTTSGSAAGGTAPEKTAHPLAAGHLAQFEAGEFHTISNAGEGRLICLMFRPEI